jgi:acetylornithine/succinyldiaminopimelate/putrescine aminotransferase
MYKIGGGIRCPQVNISIYTYSYDPIPVVFSKAQGVHVWDPEGKHYYDFLSGYSALNQGKSPIGLVILNSRTLSSKDYQGYV